MGVRARRYDGATRLARHRHARPYAALVLQGGYVEAGEHGRIRVGPGHVIHHHAHGAHLNDFEGGGALVLDLPVAHPDGCGIGILDDPDAIARAAEWDVCEAGMMLVERCRPAALQLRDWPDALAEALAAPSFIGVAQWAESADLAPQSVSRGFRRAYGVSPKR